MTVHRFRPPRLHVPRTAEIASDNMPDVLARPAPTLEWAIAGLCCERDHVLISGDGGVGKTLIALHVALALATARPVFNAWPVTRPHRVAFLDLEDSPDSLDHRSHRVAAGLGVTAAPSFTLRLVRERLVLDDPTDAADLLAFIRAHAIEWLFIDSHAAAMDGDTSSQQDVAYFHRLTVHPLREAGCGVWIIDHTRKLTGDRARDAPGESIMGARRKRNAADVHIGVALTTDDRIAWRPTKARHGALGTPLRLKMTHDPDRVTIAAQGALEPVSDELQARLLAACATEQPFQALITIGHVSERATRNAMRQLESAGLVTRRGEAGKSAFYTATPATPADPGNR